MTMRLGKRMKWWAERQSSSALFSSPAGRELNSPLRLFFSRSRKSTTTDQGVLKCTSREGGEE